MYISNRIINCKYGEKVRKIDFIIDKLIKLEYNISKESKENGGVFMELAKVTTKGQVTIPKSIREQLELKEGSKIIFLQKGNDIVIQNSAMVTLEKIQKAFEGEAERLGLETEEDVIKMIKEFRKNRKKE